MLPIEGQALSFDVAVCHDDFPAHLSRSALIGMRWVTVPDYNSDFVV